jgi:hypothetical protein
VKPYRAGSTAGRPIALAHLAQIEHTIELPQQMVGWHMVFQAEVVEQSLRRRLPPIIAGLLEYRSEKTESRSGSSLNPLYQRYRPKADVDYRGCGLGVRQSDLSAIVGPV